MHLHHDHLHRRQILQGLENDINDVGQLLGEGGSSPPDILKKDGDNANGNGNGNGNGNNSPNSPNEDDSDPTGAATLVSIVFVTASKDFSGPVRGWTTVGAPAVATAPQAAPTENPNPEQSEPSAPSQTPNASSPNSQNNPAPTQNGATQQTDSPTSLLNTIQVTSDGHLAPTNTASSGGLLGGAAASGTGAAQSSSTASAQSTGLSGGAKAGIAFGVILGLLALVAAGFAAYRYRKNQEAREEESRFNEKNPFGDSAAAPPPPTTRNTSPPMEIPSALGAIGATREPRNPEMSANNSSSNNNNPANPFGNHAETLSASPPKPVAPVSDVPATLPSTGMGEGEKLALAAGAGAVVGAAAAAAPRGSKAPAPVDVNAAQSPAGYAFKGAASPAGSQFSTTSMSSAAIAGGAPVTNVHRVQLDFKPSMDDELELKAGQLIRLLHEYDDGWALCIRLDRSQQGVVPRTCLSTRPVKPRNAPPNGSPRGPPPGMRNGPPGRQGSPGPGSPMSSSTRSPMTADPTKRSMSPGPYGGGPQQPPNRPSSQRPRSNSASNIDPTRRGNTGPSPMNPAYNSSKGPVLIPAALQPQTKPADNMQLPIQQPSPLNTPTGQAPRPVSPATSSVGSVQRKPVPGSH